MSDDYYAVVARVRASGRVGLGCMTGGPQVDENEQIVDLDAWIAWGDGITLKWSLRQLLNTSWRGYHAACAVYGCLAPSWQSLRQHVVFGVPRDHWSVIAHRQRRALDFLISGLQRRLTGSLRGALELLRPAGRPSRSSMATHRWERCGPMLGDIQVGRGCGPIAEPSGALQEEL